ncbi:MAG: ATP-binding cassette domain-containing protein, partial [Nitrospinota bacterium]
MATVRAHETTKTALARMMVGREVLFHISKPAIAPGPPILEVQDLVVRDEKGVEAVRGVSFAVHQGEILGIAGVSGNGQKELVEAITGLRRVSRGSIRLRGKNMTNASPRRIIDQGVGYIPEDRLGEGVATALSVRENLVLKHYRDPAFSGRFLLRHRRIQEFARRLVTTFDIRTPSLTTP